ncbi:MAG: glutamate--tRNA ligase [Gammaproteobacteria bacterium RBG_16_57_12]|nr:MAG: glutamate--tRNA ligase [Gammaproteobacteria bacterium RBG_16_57_12]
MTAAVTKTRFAPSPTGYLHIGNLRTALFNVLLARHARATFMLRIEDTDEMRSHEQYQLSLQEDLAWLGLDWQEGPVVGGAFGPYRQAERDSIYEKYFVALETRGLAYPCFCSEQELKMARRAQLAGGKPPRYSGKCAGLSTQEVEARLAQGLPFVLRFRIPQDKAITFNDLVRGPQNFRSEDIGDFIIRRNNGSPAFFFCNAIDDALMQVSHVVRGEDHLTNTPRQILLLEALQLPIPHYGHITLIVGHDGTPLSKRHGSRNIGQLREAGFLPEAIINYLARLGHTYDNPAFMTLEQLAADFSIARLGRSPAHYDEQQLLHWQREAVAHADPAALWQWVSGDVENLVPQAQQQAFLDAVRHNIVFPEEARHWAGVIFADDLALGEEARQAVRQAGSAFFQAAAEAVEHHPHDFKALANDLKQRTGKKGRDLFLPLRAALTGELDGPEMGQLLPLISQRRARQRLAACIQQ